MEIEVVAQSENPLFGRREIKFYAVGYDATPAREALKAELCRKLGLSPDSTIVTSIRQDFGMKRSRCEAHSYKGVDDLQRLEPKHIAARPTKEKKAKPAAGNVEAQEPKGKKA